MENHDTSFLYTKTLVHFHPFPLPFCIYEGMGETVYMVSNSVAFSSMYTPGIYRVLKSIIRHISDKPLIIDDILGMFSAQDEMPCVTWTREFISRLTSLMRITWKCTHTTDTPLFKNHDCVAFVSPLAFLHTGRLDIACAESLDNYPEKWFIIPAGSWRKSEGVFRYYGKALKRFVYKLRVPAAAVDSTWVIIAPHGVELQQVPFSKYIQVVDVEQRERPNVARERELYERSFG